MNYLVVNKPKVKTDIEEIFNYYKSFNPKLAIDYIERLHEAQVYISKIPFCISSKI
jgi:plasmid stabilization system protein ParE